MENKLNDNDVCILGVDSEGPVWVKTTDIKDAKKYGVVIIMHTIDEIQKLMERMDSGAVL